MDTFWGRQVVYPNWVPSDIPASLWQSAAEVYTPFDYMGDATATRRVTRRAIERMLDRARWHASQGSLGKAITLAKGAAHLAYENGYEDLVDRARAFVTRDLEPAYLDDFEDEPWLLSVIHDREKNVAWTWVWRGHEGFWDYLQDHQGSFRSGYLHVYYYGLDPDAALRALQWLEDSEGAKLFFDEESEKILYSAAT